MDRLFSLWNEIHIGDVYRFGRRQAVGFLRAPFRSDEIFALLDGSPLSRLIEREFPHQALRSAIDSGKTRAFIVSATDLTTGHNALFLDSSRPDVLVDPRPGVRVVQTAMRPTHCVASSAIPFLFRPVQIGERWFVDGGLRMNTPLRPVLRSGADRALVISLIQGPGQGSETPTATPNLFFLAGKTFNALLLDPVERDLHRADTDNRLVQWGVRTYGEEFVTRIDHDLDIKQAETLFVRPTEDLGRIAATLYRANPPKVSLPVRYLLSRVRDDGNSGEADLLSYLYFDRAYTGTLERLGFEDAQKMESKLVALIGSEPPET